MHRIRTTTVALLSTVALAAGAAPLAASAAPAPKEPCAQQQKQVERAESALARVTVVFDKQKDRVVRARQDVKHADTRADRAEARQALHAAKAKKEKAAKVRKAQQMRLAKATERLETCTSAQDAPAS